MEYIFTFEDGYIIVTTLVKQQFNCHTLTRGNDMKKIVIIDGGPRKNMNTAQMAASFAEGIRSASNDIEIMQFRLYDIDYKGCMSCLGCKLKGRSSKVCIYKDGLKEVLDDVSQADGFALASPIYMGRMTAQSQAFLERLVFPWLSYNDFSLSTVKKMPVVFLYTMNATEQYLPMVLSQLEFAEKLVANGLGTVEHVIACNTMQVKDYSRYEMAAASQGKAEYHEAHWAEDLKKAFDTGKKMATM